jgi:hypothetical protein
VQASSSILEFRLNKAARVGVYLGKKPMSRRRLFAETEMSNVFSQNSKVIAVSLVRVIFAGGKSQVYSNFILLDF